MDKNITLVLKRLNLLRYIDIAPFLIKKKFDRHDANQLVKFLEENRYAKFEYSNELKFIKVAGSKEEVKLDDLFIKAKITPEGKKYLKENLSGISWFLHKWKLQILVMIPASIIVGLVLWYFTANGNSASADSLNFTVFVHGPNGHDDLILRNEGTVFMDLISDKRPASINEKGEATFKEIPKHFENKNVKITVDHSQPYRVVKPDSFYILKNNSAAYVEVELVGIDKVRGIVIDGESDIPLDSVRVSILGSSVYTNQFGEFVLNIPNNEQSKFQKIRFYKEGYSIKLVDSIPTHTKAEVEVLLNRNQ